MGLIRWLQKLLGMAAFTLIIVSLTLATSWYAVQYAFQQWVDHSEGLIPSLLGDGSADRELAAMASVHVASPMVTFAPIATASGTGSREVATGSATNADAAQATPQVSKDPHVIVDAEQFAVRKNGLSNADKLRIYELFIKRVPEKELRKISAMLEGGISDAEIKKLQQVLKTYFPKEEREEIEAMWNRWSPKTSPNQSPKPTG